MSVKTSIPAVKMKCRDFQEFLHFASQMDNAVVCILTVQKAMHEMDKVADFTDNI